MSIYLGVLLELWYLVHQTKLEKLLFLLSSWNSSLSCFLTENLFITNRIIYTILCDVKGLHNTYIVVHICLIFYAQPWDGRAYSVTHSILLSFHDHSLFDHYLNHCCTHSTQIWCYIDVSCVYKYRLSLNSSRMIFDRVMPLEFTRKKNENIISTHSAQIRF